MGREASRMDVQLFKALSDGTRLKMVELLSRRVYCVRALSLMLEISESAVSQHMKILRDVGLVEGVKFGYYTHYRLRRDAIEQIGQSLLALAARPHDGQDCDAAEKVGCRTTKQA